MGSSKRYTHKPIRVMLSGDKSQAKTYIRQAQVQSQKLDENMAFQSLDQGASNWISDDKNVTIKVVTTFNERKIEIFHAPNPDIDTVDKEKKRRKCDCYGNFAECEILNISRYGGSSIPALGDYDEYCVCFDILVCCPNCPITDDGVFKIWTGVRPSDFTRYEPGDIAIVVFDNYTPDSGESTVCGGFSSSQATKGHVDYVHPVIVPIVCREEDVNTQSYKPVIACGLIDGETPMEAHSEQYFFRTSAVRGSYTYFRYYLRQAIYPVIDFSKTNDINMSIHNTNINDTPFLYIGDQVINPSVGWSSGGFDYGEIRYRNRDYNDGDNLSEQLLGGSLAFRGNLINSIIGVSVDVLNGDPVGVYSMGVVLGHSHNALGNVADGRAVLRPASMWHIKKIDTYNTYQVYDIRGGFCTDLLQDDLTFWEYDPSEPIETRYPTYSDISYFREIFAGDEIYGGSVVPILSPEVMQYLGSPALSAHESVEIYENPCVCTYSSVFPNNFGDYPMPWDTPVPDWLQAITTVADFDYWGNYEWKTYTYGDFVKGLADFGSYNVEIYGTQYSGVVTSPDTAQDETSVRKWWVYRDNGNSLINSFVIAPPPIVMRNSFNYAEYDHETNDIADPLVTYTATGEHLCGQNNDEQFLWCDYGVGDCPETGYEDGCCNVHLAVTSRNYIESLSILDPDEENPASFLTDTVTYTGRTQVLDVTYSDYPSDVTCAEGEECSEGVPCPGDGICPNADCPSGGSCADDEYYIDVGPQVTGDMPTIELSQVRNRNLVIGNMMFCESACYVDDLVLAHSLTCCYYPIEISVPSGTSDMLLKAHASSSDPQCVLSEETIVGDSIK